MSKKVVIFLFVRVFGVFIGLITVSYQYQLPFELKQFFHQFTFLSLFVYLLDGGYSEKITQINQPISKKFLKKALLYFFLLIITGTFCFYFISFSHHYVRWLLASAFIIPFQMYADVLYRIILKSNKSLSFVIYQALSPTIILTVLISCKSIISQNKLWLVFLGSNILIQLFYLFYIYFFNKQIFRITNTNTSVQIFDMEALAYKLFPLIVYEVVTIFYNTQDDNVCGYGLELIRSCYFIVGFVLLLIYTKNEALFRFIKKAKLLGIIFLIVIVSFTVSAGIAYTKFLISNTTPKILQMDVFIYLLMVVLYATYIYKYTNWVYMDKQRN